MAITRRTPEQRLARSTWRRRNLPSSSAQQVHFRSHIDQHSNSSPRESASQRNASDFSFAEDRSHSSGGDEYETESVMTLCLPKGENDESESEAEQGEVSLKFVAAAGSVDRPRSAPARPLTPLEELRASRQFANLEAAVMIGNQLIQKPDGKFDLDSEEGQRSCKLFFKELESLFKSFRAQQASRGYRENFSEAYKVLYKEHELCYLTEILDSAQEGFPYLWVNSEKYIFSGTVLASAKELFDSFARLVHMLKSVYTRVCEESPYAEVKAIVNELRFSLYRFDRLWAKFEKVL